MYAPISILIALPLITAVGLAMVPSTSRAIHRGVALLVGVIELVGAVLLWANYTPGSGQDFTESYPWLPLFNISISFGVDGTSILLFLLTTLMTLVVMGYILTRDEHLKPMLIGSLVMLGSLLAVFAARDLVVFYIFFELMLIPTWLLMGAYGQTVDGVCNKRAAIKFFVYTLVGGFAMLGAVIYIGVYTGTTNLDMLATTPLPIKVQIPLFMAFVLSFGIKLPIFPLHTWQADAYTTAPVAVTVMLTSVMAKIGAYGILRLNVGLLPDATEQIGQAVIIMAVIGIIWGAIVSAIQDDLKRLLAYSSLAHLGFVSLGLMSNSMIGLQGAVIQMFNHGITTGVLFILVGIMADRAGTTSIKAFGGLLAHNPMFGGMFILSAMASVALPGLNGFVGEFPILLGSFTYHPIMTTIATSGVVLAGVYLLWAIERVFMGPVSGQTTSIGALTRGELVIIVPLLALMLAIGLYPKPLYTLVGNVAPAHSVQATTVEGS